jgi:hypothetical protein
MSEYPCCEQTDLNYLAGMDWQQSFVFDASFGLRLSLSDPTLRWKGRSVNSNGCLFLRYERLTTKLD